MNEEINVIKRNPTWELTSLLEGHKAIEVKWIFKTKRNVKREIEKYKIGLVVKGNSMKLIIKMFLH
jgi:hypothetical protein